MPPLPLGYDGLCEIVIQITLRRYLYALAISRPFCYLPTAYLSANQDNDKAVLEWIKAMMGFEPMLRVLQTPTLPLSHIATLGAAGLEPTTNRM